MFKKNCSVLKTLINFNFIPSTPNELCIYLIYFMYSYCVLSTGILYEYMDRLEGNCALGHV